jgi:oligopeptide/dipeptide ABC transporter ATP-binding protein
MTSLNTVFTIGNQVMESVSLHLNNNKKEARKITKEILKKVGIPSPESRVNDYPLIVRRNAAKGCRFHPRCPYCMEICKKSEPELINISQNHQSACWLNEQNKK